MINRLATILTEEELCVVPLNFFNASVSSFNKQMDTKVMRKMLLVKYIKMIFIEGFFTTEIGEEEKDKPLKRGRGSQKKTEVLVMTESVPLEDGVTTKAGKPHKVGHIKMFDLKSETIGGKVIENIDKQSIIDSDNSTSYTNFRTLVMAHRPKVMPKPKVAKMLPWVHIAISNAKKILLDIFHDIRPEYLQNYLNEFCYKFNCRYFGEQRFDRLMVAAVTYKNQFRYNIE